MVTSIIVFLATPGGLALMTIITPPELYISKTNRDMMLIVLGRYILP